MAYSSNNRLSLNDILAIKYPENHEWSPAGKYISFLWEDGGKRGLWLRSVSQEDLQCIVNSEIGVTEYTWSPHGSSILYVSEGDIWHVEVNLQKKVKLISATCMTHKPSWSPSGDRFAFLMGKDVWLYSYPDHGIQQLVALDKTARIKEGKAFSWSHNGDKLAVVFAQDVLAKLIIVNAEDANLIWKSENNYHALEPIWLPKGNKLIYKKISFDSKICDYMLLDLDTQEEVTLLKEQDERGLPFSMPSEALSPNGDYLALISSRDGWDHLWLLELKSGGLRQLTKGLFEDRGYATDVPTWDPDSRKIAFSSSRENLIERQIWTISPDGEDLKKITNLPGTNTFPRWSPDGRSICFIHSGPYKSPDLWLVEVSGEHKVIQLTNSMPESFTEDKIVVPRPVTYKSIGGWNIHANLFKPKGFSPKEKYPAIIFLHGGPIRQMRCGWHPTRGYSIFYSFHQYLTQQGYIILDVNYRSGIGYGKSYQQGNYLSVGEDECLDVVHAAKYLKSQAFVDSSRVGVWGISYGGFLTLQALGKYPDVFKVGVNIAGVVNWFELLQWYEKIHPESASFFKTRITGGIEADQDKYCKASPINFVKNMVSPICNFHGSADDAVPFSQMDELIVELVKEGKDFEVVYYPGESHLFGKKETWKDVFSRIERYFKKYLE